MLLALGKTSNGKLGIPVAGDGVEGADAGGEVGRVVVVREVLVTRCKYCGELRRADLTECTSCGGKI